ncbi:MAG: hypothetical protein ACK6DF_09010, partial [Betaproteobacteria bacterium]
MQKIEAASPEAQSANLVVGNVAQLKALFPELVTEGPHGPGFQPGRAEALVGDATVTGAEEKYGLNWHGKRAARQLALTPSTGSHLPCGLTTFAARLSVRWRAIHHGGDDSLQCAAHTGLVVHGRVGVKA